jgi:acyl-CoA synthetase (AMP-forming)/AMP-acid ligase II
VVERAAIEHPDLPAIIDGATTLTFAELLDVARRGAGALVAAEIQPGARVAIWAPNSLEWATAALAIAFAGAVAVPLNTRYTATEAGDIVVRSGAVAALAQDEFLGRRLAAEARDIAGGIPVFSLGDGRGEGSDRWSDHVVAAPVSATSTEVERRLRTLAPSDVSHVQFTSGTTGRPKGAMLRHQAMALTTATWVGTVGLHAGDRYPIVSPFSHIGGHKTGVLACIIAGAAAIPMPVLDVDVLVATIVDRGVTFMMGPPTMFHDLVGRVRSESLRLDRVRTAVTGAAAIPPTLIRDLFDVVGIRRVFTAYGLTEATGVCTLTAADDPVEIIAQTSGRPIPGVEVRIGDAAGEPRPPGERGEICIRGLNVMAGYLDDPAATAEAIRDGWLHTGDVGTFDEHGCLRIVDRLNDMIVVGGLNAYPAEIERVLMEHPGVAQAAVVGMPDERLGEVPAAFVVARGGALTDENLDRFCRQRLANFKVPRRFVFLDALPLNASGKVLKPELRARAAG